MNFRKLGWVFVFLALSYATSAQCPPQTNLKKFIETAQIAELLVTTEQLVDCPQQQDSLGYLWHKLGTKSHHDNLLLAIEYTNNAVKVREKALPKNHPDIGYSYFNLGAFYKRLGRLDLAQANYKVAATIFKANDEVEKYRKKLGRTYIELGSILEEVGDYDNALNYLNIAEKQAKNIQDTTGILHALEKKAVLFFNKNDIADSQAALAQINVLIANLPKQNNVLNLFVNLLLNEGRNASYLNDYELALSKFKTAEPILERLQDKDNICTCYTNLGHTYYKLKQYDSAKRYYKKIINGDFPTCKSYVYNNLADIYFQEKNYAEALQQYDNALLSIANLPAPFTTTALRKQLPKIKDKPLLLTYINDLAKRVNELSTIASYKKQSKKQLQLDAIALYYLIDETIDQMRKQHYDQNSKLFWRNEVHPIYEEAVKTFFALERWEDALYFSEKSKAILLYDQVSENVFQSSIADSLRNKIQALDVEIVYWEGKSALTPKQQILVLELKEKRNLQSQAIQAKYPAYSRLKNETLALQLEDILPILPNNSTVLFEFFYGKDALYIFQLSRNHPLQARKIELDTNFVAQLKTFASYFRNQGKNLFQDKNKYQELANALYQQLFTSDLSGYSNLLLIPDGLLHNLPFDALLTATDETKNFNNLAYLGRDKCISYGYSIPILQLQKANNPKATQKDVLAIFPEFQLEERGNPFLSFSQAEMKGMSQATRLYTLNKRAATKGKLRNLAGQYPVIHFSSHATAGSSDKPPSIELFDSTLFLAELYDLKLNADLVVLSSCETGMGEYEAGEGVMSLARGFTFAGGNSLVSTLWQVNDASTSKIMVTFYKELAAGKTKAAALHSAKLRYLNDPTVSSRYKSPYYWAGFIYVGNDSAIALAKPLRKWWPLLGLSFVGLSIFILGFWKLRHAH